MPGRPGPPRPVPDRVFTIEKRFVDRYPAANQLLADLRVLIEEECAWAEASINATEIRIVVWYGEDITTCLAGMKPMGDALADWDRHK